MVAEAEDNVVSSNVSTVNSIDTFPVGLKMGPWFCLAEESSFQSSSAGRGEYGSGGGAVLRSSSSSDMLLSCA